MEYDIVIIGIGPAGLTAGLYAARRGLKTLVIGEKLGGQLALAPVVENYPGAEKISGLALAKIMLRQARGAGCTVLEDRVTDINLREKTKKIKAGKKTYAAKTAVICTGAVHRKLNIPGEEKYIGCGVSYCAACDAPMFKGKTVAVIGGSDAAVDAALYLVKIAKKVYLVHRRSELRAEESAVAELKKSKAEIIWDTAALEIRGEKFVQKLILENVNTKKQTELAVGGVFIYVGNVPSTELVKKEGIAVDDRGFIKINEKCETNIAGVFAAGDVTGGILQATQAIGQGATAATNAFFYIKKPYFEQKG